MALRMVELLVADLAEHIDGPPEHINKNAFLSDLLSSDEIVDIKSQFKVVPVNKNKQIHGMLYAGQTNLHFLRSLLQTLGQLVQQYLEEVVIVELVVITGVELLLAVGFAEMLVVDVLQFADVGYQHLLVEELVEDQWEDHFYSFALDQEEGADEVEKFVDLDVEEISGAELHQVVFLHHIHVNKADLSQFLPVRHDNRPVVLVYLPQDIYRDETAGILLAEKVDEFGAEGGELEFEGFVVFDQGEEEEHFPVYGLLLVDFLFQEEVYVPFD